MQTPSTGTNMTIFVLFFGIALLEAFRTRDWLWVAFWILIGLSFLGMDRWGRRKRNRARRVL